MNDNRSAEEIKEEVSDLIKDNPLTIEEISTEVEISRGEALEICDLMNAKEKGIYFYLGRVPNSFSSNTKIELNVQKKKITEDNKRLRKQNKELLTHLESVQQAESFKNKLDSSLKSAQIHEIPKVANTNEEQVACLLCLSDWHIGETVDFETVGGINEFYPEIAEDRALNYFRNAKNKIKALSQIENINQLIIWLGGDFISGYIHPELEENNSMSPLEEAKFMSKILTHGINLLVEGLDLEVRIVTSYGNHGRNTFKKRFSTGAFNNFEYMTYDFIYPHISDKIVDWYNEPSDFSYIKVYDKTIRFSHGDNFKGKGGNNFTSSILRQIENFDKQQKADLDVFGHFHTLTFNSKFVCNGSLIGPSAFSLGCGFPAEPPQQALCLLSDTHPNFIKANYSINPLF